MPTLRQLQIFLAVARGGHLTRAAQQLNLTQPAVSHQIRQLEQSLRTQLVVRVGRRLALTQAGETLLSDVAPILASLDATLAQAGGRPSAQLSGTVRIATLQSYNESLVVRAATMLARQHADIRLVVREMAADAIESQIIEGQADLGLTFQVRRRTALQTQVLMRERLLVVTSAEDALPRAEGLAALAGRRMALMPREYALRAMIDDLAACEGIAWKVAFESSNLAALIAYARATQAVTIVPQFAIHRLDGIVVSPLPDSAMRQINLIGLPGPRSLVVQAAIDAIIAATQAG